MLSSIKQRLDREDEGFTLIELMVVVLIIAILLAIAIPTFLGARNAANARAAQSNLRNALTAEQTYYTNNSQAFDYAGTGVQSIEPSLTFVSAWPSSNVSPNTVLISQPTDGVALTALGKDGNCYSVETINVPASGDTAGTYYYQTTKNSAGGCGAPATFATGSITQAHAASPAGTWSISW